jgi:Tol biopolymer transport system component
MKRTCLALYAKTDEQSHVSSIRPLKISFVRMKRNLVYLFLLLIILSACNESVKLPVMVNAKPALYPDYTDVTVPATVAPLNFTITAEKFDRIDVVVSGVKNGELHVQSKDIIQFPQDEWRQLLSDNKGKDLRVVVSLKQDGKWKQYQPFAIHVSSYPIDYGLVYRMIAPGYEVYSKMGIYQRDLSSFDQKAIVENTLVTGSCVNCHAFNKNNPAEMNLHIRGANGATMLLVNGKMELYTTKTDSTISSCVYPYWHPSGKYIAYSVNQTRQAFHVVRNERIEVFDQASDVVVYNLKTNQLMTSPLLKTSDFETFPVFSPDGKTLYFCLSKKQEIQSDYKKIKYSLCKIAFDPATGKFGNKVDTVISATKTSKSISFPRPSFDGKYLMYTQSDYGNFSIWHREADLYLLDLKTGVSRPLTEVNSNNTESFHDWSSNSHWFVFSSRRGDGLYTRLYIASIDDKGKVSKPFLLPQKDPRFYDASLFSYNVPEFVTAPVRVNANELEKGLLKKDRKKMAYVKF